MNKFDKDVTRENNNGNNDNMGITGTSSSPINNFIVGAGHEDVFT